MPFNRMPEAGSLIAQIDTAMARADDIGDDMIRDLMPELRDMIDEVNAALREIDALLFEGLRDEALTLHDDDLPMLASRLNLEDRAGWPELERFLVVEGISLPPTIDYDTLSALESAHAELESLRRPLDKLRRLVMERAPLARRLALLRKICNADPTKPVWALAITDHEEARVAELHEEVRRALATRNPNAIAALYAELVDPEWGVPVPKDLIKATRGADVWIELRGAAEQAKQAVEGMEAGWRELQESPPTVELIGRLRELRMLWHETLQKETECHQHLVHCPTIAAFVRAEGLDQHFKQLAPRVQSALQWLSAQDLAESLAGQLGQVCGQLEYLCDQKPDKPGESAWLADMERLEAEAHRLCQTQAGLVYPELLQQRVNKSAADVRGRAARRRRLFVLATSSAVVVVCLLVAVVGLWLYERGRYLEATTELERYVKSAKAGEFVEFPAKATDIQKAYPNDPPIAEDLQEVSRFIDDERQRRIQLQASLDEFDERLESARKSLRNRQGSDQVEEWPPEVVEAARAWRAARKIGGVPGNRLPSGNDSDEENNVVASMHAKEEDKIATREMEQKNLEKEYDRAAAGYVRLRSSQLMQAPPAELYAALEEVERLIALYTLDKTKGANALLEAGSRLRFSDTAADLLKKTRQDLEERKKRLPLVALGNDLPTAEDGGTSPGAAETQVDDASGEVVE